MAALQGQGYDFLVCSMQLTVKHAIGIAEGDSDLQTLCELQMLRRGLYT